MSLAERHTWYTCLGAKQNLLCAAEMMPSEMLGFSIGRSRAIASHGARVIRDTFLNIKGVDTESAKTIYVALTGV
jgi:hypothetical protein